MNDVEADLPLSREGTTNFVLGVPHSGTTILYRLLGRHPELGWFSQFSQRGGTVPGRFRLPGWEHYNRWARSLFGTPWKKNSGPLQEWFVPMPREAIATWHYLLPRKGTFPQFPPNVWTKRCIDRAMCERFRTVMTTEFRAWRRTKLLFKLPRLIQAMPVLTSLLPDNRFVHIVRDGRAVAASIRFKFETESRTSREALLAAGKFWREVLKTFRETADGKDSRIKTIRQEDLLDNPTRVFESLLSFLNLDEERYPWPLPSLKSDPNRKWKERLSDREIQELNDLLEDELTEWNYPETWSRTRASSS